MTTTLLGFAISSSEGKATETDDREPVGKDRVPFLIWEPLSVEQVHPFEGQEGLIAPVGIMVL